MFGIWTQGCDLWRQAEAGRPGDPCSEHADCATGYCIRGINGEDICAEFCMEDEDCEDNYVCRA